jgi:hypothetical protein
MFNGVAIVLVSSTCHVEFLGNQNLKPSYAIESYMKSQIDLLKTN